LIEGELARDLVAVAQVAHDPLKVCNLKSAIFVLWAVGFGNMP